MFRNEKDLYREVLAGKEKARRLMYDQSLPYLYGICKRYSIVDDDIDDVLQETYIKAFGNIESFKWTGEGSFAAWLRKICVNGALNQLSSYKRNRMMTIENEQWDDIGDTIEGDWQPGDLQIPGLGDMPGYSEEMLLSAIDSLPEPFRIVFNLFAVENYHHAEIAQMLNIPEKTSTTRMYRARKMLAEKISETNRKNKVQLA